MTPDKQFRPIIPKGSISSSPSVQLPRRGRRTLATEKCDVCRKDKKACVRQGLGCERCSEKGLKCPGFTPRPKRRRKGDSNNVQAPDKALAVPTGPKLVYGTTTFISKSLADSSHRAAFISNRVSFIAPDSNLRQSLEPIWSDMSAIDDVPRQPSLEFVRLLWETNESTGDRILEISVLLHLMDKDLIILYETHDQFSQLRKKSCTQFSFLECGTERRKGMAEEEHRCLNPICDRRKSMEENFYLRLPGYLLSLTINHGKEAHQMDRLQVFRLNFIEQYKLLAKAAKDPSARIRLVNQGVHGHEQGWASAMVAMRQLVRLKRPSLVDVLCFLCVSRAVAETHNKNKDIYVSAFNHGLEQWRLTYLEIENAVRLMWGITFEFPPQLRATAKQYNELLQLRNSVAALIEVEDDRFGLGGWERQNKMNLSRDNHPQSSGNINQASRYGAFSDHLWSSKEVEPPDRQICPAITDLHRRTRGKSCWEIATTVSTTTFALVVHFILGSFYNSASDVLGLTNPWYTASSRTASTARGQSSETRFSSRTDTVESTLLSRPPSPLQPVYPNFGTPPCSLPTFDDALFDNTAHSIF
ncbi:hypothetical protein F5Y08DRAFT_323674 [Xylaria arbuscula]|nr:hypothetical protein F5Y08DRAFT_323674 [Xylaria arbuscula]